MTIFIIIIILTMVLTMIVGNVLLDDEPAAELVKELDGGGGSLSTDGAVLVDRRVVRDEFVRAE